MMTDHPAIRRCVCGHLEVDHGRSRGGHMFANRSGGPCFVRDCGCDQFDWQHQRDVETLSKAAHTPADEEAA